MNAPLSEESLRESEELYRFLVENTPDGFFIAEIPSGKLSFVNSKLCEIFGVSPEKAGEISIWNGLSPEEHEIVSERIHKVIKDTTPSPRRYIYSMRRMDGTTFKGEVSLSNMMFREKMVIQGIVRDVTEQIRLQDQLRHAQKMEAIGTLAGGIAHEFNNLMQAVSGYTELLLLNTALDSPSKQKLEAIRKSTQRASELTRQILIFSQKVESKVLPVRLNHEVMRIFKLLKKTLPKMIEIKVSSDEHVRDIQADPALIGQILMNLSINARDAMPDGGTLFISTSDVFLDEQYYRNHPELKPGHYALLSISDTGCGMDKETKQHLFEPFYTTKGTGKGTGLGLAMVYGIVKEHGGHIVCYSESGMGTTFRIYLPVADPPKDIPELASEKYPGGTETILLADDEEFIRNSGKELLERFGYTVLIAADGEEALEIYRQKSDSIDLVMLDLLMPGMGGKKCLEEILAIHPAAKVLIASGYSQDKINTEAMAIGAAEFIGKPYQVGELLKIIRKVSDKHQV